MHLPALQRSKFPHGLVVAPCLTARDAAGSYVLEVHSEAEVGVEAVAEARSKTVAGEWGDATAGGSHLQPTWRTNPCYRLQFATATARPKVAISLTRPENEWKTQDMVGAMFGFYVNRAGTDGNPSKDPNHGIVHDGAPWDQSPFVPLHAVATPPGMALDPSETPYLIMPATYAPGKKGKFFLTVTSDVDFTLTADKGVSVPN